MGLAGQRSTNAAADMATGMNRVVLGPMPKGVAEGGESDEEMAEVEEEEAIGDATNCKMADTEIATTAATETTTETEMGALATND